MSLMFIIKIIIIKTKSRFLEYKMSVVTKIDRQQLRILLDLIKQCTSEAYISFESDEVELSFFNDVDKSILSVINIPHESYINNLKDDDKVVRIGINPCLLFNEIENLPKNKYISLSITPESNLMKVESVN